MSEVPPQSRIAWPATKRVGWNPAKFDVSTVWHELGAAELSALNRVIDRQAGKPLTDTAHVDFADPVLDAFLRPLVVELSTGPGLTFISGFPVGSVSLDRLRFMYWVVGSWFGDPVSQNWTGARMGEVAVAQGAAEGRAYASAGELPLHSDRIDILSLLCVRKATQGGESVFGSSLWLWEKVAAERPDLLPILQRGFPQWRNGEEAEGDEPITPYNVPVFGEKNGLRSCLFSGNASLPTVRKRIPIELSPLEEEALSYLGEQLQRPESKLVMQLEPGQAVFLNNYEVLHGRTRFEDEGGPEGRLLLRLWLEGRPRRPRQDEQTVTRNRSGHQGIDPKPALASA